MAADGAGVVDAPFRMEGDPPERLDVLAAIVEHIPAAVFAKDVEGRYILVNSTVEQQMGRPRAEILGKTDLELLSPAVAAAFVANDRRAIESGEPKARGANRMSAFDTNERA